MSKLLTEEEAKPLAEVQLDRLKSIIDGIVATSRRDIQRITKTYGEVREHYNSREPEEKKQYDDILSELREYGADITRKFYEPILDQITIDYLKHDKQKEPMLLSEYNEKVYCPIDMDELVRHCNYNFGMVIKEYVATGDFEQGMGRGMVSVYRTDNRFIRMGRDEHTCGVCGQHMQMGLDLATLAYKPYKQWSRSQSTFVDPIECQHTDLGVYDYEFNVPSGKLVFANSMYRAMGEELTKKLEKESEEEMNNSNDCHGVSICQDLGLKINSLYHAKHGLLHVQCGNSSPSVFYNKKLGKMVIRNENFDHETDEELDAKLYPNLGKEVASICTDLWAVTAMDWDDYIAHCERNEKDPKEMLGELDATVVKVEAGTYKVTDYYISSTFKRDNENGYATLEIIK